MILHLFKYLLLVLYSIPDIFALALSLFPIIYFYSDTKGKDLQKNLSRTFIRCIRQQVVTYEIYKLFGNCNQIK